MSKREAFIDYGKALMIILVIAFHVGFDTLEKISYIMMIYFFLVSGYTYVAKKKSLKDRIISRFKTVLIPFWILMAVYAIVEIIRGSLLGYGGTEMIVPSFIGAIYGSSHNLPFIKGISEGIVEIMSYKPQDAGFVDVILPTNCHLWFLPAMFCGSVIFFIYIEKVKRTKIKDTLFIIFCVLIASLETLPFMIQLPYGLGRGFLAAASMLVGYILKEKDVFNIKGKFNLLYLLVLVITIVCYFLGGKDAALVRSVYGPYGMIGTFIVFIGGVTATIIILKLLKPLNNINKDNIILDIGRNTMFIYSWHMIFLNLIALIFLVLFKIMPERDIYFMKIIPSDHKVLMILTIVLSILACMVVIKIKNRIKNKNIVNKTS